MESGLKTGDDRSDVGVGVDSKLWSGVENRVEIGLKSGVDRRAESSVGKSA